MFFINRSLWRNIFINRSRSCNIFLKRFKRDLVTKYLWLIFSLFWEKINIKSAKETIKWVCDNQGSLIRFGDAEFSIMGDLNFNTFYQRKTEFIKGALLETFSERDNKLLICIPEVFDRTSMERATESSQYFWKVFLMKSYFFFRKILDKSYEYGNAQVSRPYIRLRNRTRSSEVFNMFKEVFANRNIVIVEGELTRFGVGNDLLSCASSVRRIIVPAKDAFTFYDQIKEACNSICDPDLFLLAIGPTSKPLALHLFKRGIQVLDLGHLDIEYEWFLRKVEKKVLIPGKYVSEVPGHFNKADEHLLDLSEYNKQIVFKVG